MDVAPNGDLYVTDGYASDYVHRFDRDGKYLKSFGGKKEALWLQDAAQDRDRHALFNRPASSAAIAANGRGRPHVTGRRVLWA